jgi:hypothetical protein
LPNNRNNMKERADETDACCYTVRAPLEPQPHCMQKLFSPAERVHGMAVGRGGVGPEPCYETLRRRTTSCLARSNARGARGASVVASPVCLPLLQRHVAVASSKPGVTGSSCQQRVWLYLGKVLALLQHSLPFLLLPCPCASVLGRFACSTCVSGWLTGSAAFPECAQRARPSVSRPSLLGNNPPPQAQPLHRAVRRRPKTSRHKNRITEHQFFQRL